MESLETFLQNSYQKSMKHLEGFPVNPVPTHNIATKLALREISSDSPPRAYHRQRGLYQCIVPNYTEPHVQVPSGYLRKFSPDGNLLLGFSSDQKSVIVYSYHGAGSGHSLYEAGQDSDYIRSNIFKRFFTRKHIVHIPDTHENLNRECSLFTDDGRHVIVGSSLVVPDEPYPPNMYDQYRSNESVSANGRYQLEDYTLYAVDIKAGYVSDFKTFKCDKIYISHNQGLSLCESMLAVLSVQHQTVYLFSIEHGTFVRMHDVGRFCYPDDPAVYSRTKYFTGDDQTNEVKPFHELWFTSLKHRLLCWHLQDAERRSTPENHMPVLNIFQKFDILAELKIWKMQLLSRKHMVLKFASKDVVTHKATDPMSQPALIGVYNIETTQFESVFENTSEDLLQVYENHSDHFRVPVSHPLSSNVSSVSNDRRARALHMKFKQTITNARYGGKTEATRRLLGQIPMCCQCLSSSPYLDSALFSYDDKWVSALERPKNVADSPVRFFCRNSGDQSFALHLETGLPLPPSHSRRLVAYIFHPSEPFVISIQKAGFADYVVCFHFRNTRVDNSSHYDASSPTSPLSDDSSS